MGLAAACVVNAVCGLSTLGSLKARHIFNPLAKWSPLSFMKLTHEVICCSTCQAAKASSKKLSQECLFRAGARTSPGVEPVAGATTGIVHCNQGRFA